MNALDREYLLVAAGCIDRLLGARGIAPVRPVGLTPELQAFAERFDRLLEQLAALHDFAATLASGDLGYQAPARQRLLDPLKQLQANLRHLTWQTQQIAGGDLDQQVDFLGDFSQAFNQMIAGLREKRRAEEQLRYLSLHDALTGLYNRTYFNEELGRLVSSTHFPVSLLIADVDGLKAVNDTHGHSAGDLLIQKAARVLEHGVRVEGAVVRLGGDEFAVILYRTDRAGAAAVAASIRDSLREYSQRDPCLPVSLSLGIGTATVPAALEGALREADEAMYLDKLSKRREESYPLEARASR